MACCHLRHISDGIKFIGWADPDLYRHVTASGAGGVDHSALFSLCMPYYAAELFENARSLLGSP